MMKLAESDAHSAGHYAFAAMRDARIRNETEKSHYTEQEIIRAERMKYGLELVYACKEIHINYRKKFIAVKVESDRVIDRKNLSLLEEDYATEGVEKLITAQGIIYRIPKK